MVEGQPARPANIENVVAINQGRLPLTRAEPEARWLPPREAAAMVRNPRLRLVDVRGTAGFGQAHAPGAVNVQLASPEFEQRLGWILEPGAPIVLIGEGDGEEIRRALRKLAFLGLDARVEGAVEGGMAAWVAEGLPHESLPQVSVHDLHDNLKGGGPSWRVVDVREDEEWRAGHIGGACHLNFKRMGPGAERFPFGRDEILALVCATGQRSSTGASLLGAYGFTRLRNVVGGMDAWRAAGYGVVNGA